MRLEIAACLCLLVGCRPSGPSGNVQQVQSVDVSDPALTSKLGVTTQEWITIRQLASQDKGFTIMSASRVGKDTIDLDMKKVDDVHGDQGGPVQQLEMKEGHWVLQSNFNGWWAIPK